jgi:hypothetical protein
LLVNFQRASTGSNADPLDQWVARLREGRALLSEVYNAFGSTWPQRYVEDIGAFLERSGQDAS